MTVVLREANYETYRLQRIINSTFMDKMHTRLKYTVYHQLFFKSHSSQSKIVHK